LYENLKSIEQNDIDYKIILLNKLELFYYIFMGQIPYILLLVIIKNILYNFSIDTKIYVIKNNSSIVHYSVIQFRNNQYKNLFKRDSLEIGPSFTQVEYRNKKYYQSAINFLIKEYKEKNIFAIVRQDNEASISTFKKFSGKEIKLEKNKKIISYYRKLY